MKGGNLCLHKCFMLYFFLISNSEALQLSELWRYFLSEIIKRPLNYHLMVILPATCGLQNPITTLMKSISSWPQPLYTWTLAFRRWLYGCCTKVTAQGQSHNPDAWIPPKHFTSTLQNEWLQTMEWLMKETFKMSF